MKTFGTLISEARKAAGMSQRELAAQVKKEDGQAISSQYLNDIEHDRRNPPPEYLIGQIAEVLKISKDMLCAAAGTLPADLKKLAATQPAKFEEAFQAFRRELKPKK
jgi:transcriptional regulator with XRE-family HTH domain